MLDEEAPLERSVVRGIVESPRAPGRYTLELEDGPSCSVSLEIIERLGLRIGAVLDAPKLAQLANESTALKTYDRALRMLAARARSRVELGRRLTKAGESPEHVAAALDRLVANGLLDDAAYARQVARAKLVDGRMSKRRLSMELSRRGVARTESAEAIAEVVEDEQIDEGANAERAARKKLRSLGGLDLPTQRRRLYGYLARRGFDSGEIGRVMKQVLAEGAEDEESDVGAED